MRRKTFLKTLLGMVAAAALPVTAFAEEPIKIG